MSFFSDVGKGLSFVGGFVPGAQGLAVAGKLALMVGKPDALVPNPARERPYEPHGVLWGIPKTKAELVRWGWTAPGLGEGQTVQAALSAEAQRRGSVERLVGHVVRLPTGMFGGYTRVRVTGEGSIGLAEFLRLDQYNLVVKAWLARIEAHGSADPVFDYIDTRPWSVAGEELFWDYLGESKGMVESDRQLREVNGKKFWIGPGDLAAWLLRKNPAAEAAYATWSAFHADELVRYDAERAAWRAWKTQVADELERQRQVELLEQQFNQVWATTPNKGEAAQMMQALVASASAASASPGATYSSAPSAAGVLTGSGAPSSGLLVAIAIGLVVLVALGDG